MALLPRLTERRLKAALADSPVVLVHGPRQCGKTTLARLAGERKGYSYVSFDDPGVRDAAAADPIGFVDELPQRVILDELQHAPRLFSAIKSAVDRRRTPGRFILTGSANVLLVPALSDSLAGRMEILRLHPFAQSEIERRESRFLDRLFGDGFPFRQVERLGADLARRVVTGGYPPAVSRASARRGAWYRSYIESIVQRDVRDLTRIASLEALPRLLQTAAAQTACLFNASTLAAPFQLSLPTIRDYLVLLEHVFLLERVAPWHTNQLSRLVKTPKLHLGDSGLAAELLGVDERSFGDRTLLGQLLETFVYQELRRMASGRDDAPRFFHFRDRDGVEVDLVIELGARAVAAVEVKTGATVTESDFRGIRKLAQAAGRRFVRGIVLHDGNTVLPFGQRLQAVPIRMLWEA